MKTKIWEQGTERKKDQGLRDREQGSKDKALGTTI